MHTYFGVLNAEAVDEKVAIKYGGSICMQGCEKIMSAASNRSSTTPMCDNEPKHAMTIHLRERYWLQPRGVIRQSNRDSVI